MVEILSKENSTRVLTEEKKLLDWKEVLKKFQITFGNDVYESWIKNINLR